MRHTFLLRAAHCTTIGVLLLATAGCRMKSQEEPGLTGPSEFGKSVVVEARPDILSQDGISQSEIVVKAFGRSGEPLPNESMNVELWVETANGPVRSDFGTLSARNIRTGSNGEARLIYTAPPSPALSTVAWTEVTIAVTPLGTNYANSSARFASIRVIPVGLVVPPDGLAPHFSFTPTNPVENQQVLFQACADPERACAPADNPIVEYDWTFGDGNGGNSQFETHTYDVAGSYTVTLSVSDRFGRTASTVQQVIVGGASGPTAAFVFSPASPAPNQTIAFNATGSTAPAGREIDTYTWDFGDGKGQHVRSSPTINYSYATEGEYNVTLVVTDDTGKKSSVTIAVTVETP